MDKSADLDLLHACRAAEAVLSKQGWSEDNHTDPEAVALWALRAAIASVAEDAARQTERTVMAMQKFGGAFVRQLACAWTVADSENRSRLEQAFSPEFSRYQELGRKSEVRL